jgi:hypothetical protein
MRLSRDGNKLPQVHGRMESQATRNILFLMQLDRHLVVEVRVVPAMVLSRRRSRKKKPKPSRRSKLVKLSRNGRRMLTTLTMTML